MARIVQAVEDVRRENPMAPSITNTVTINLVANTQLAVGGSAAMVYLPDEAVALAQVAKSFYVNVGTMLPVYEETFVALTEALKGLDLNWVLDPVAVGIGKLRTFSLLKFKEAPPKIIRGNASEIMALCGLWGLEGGEDQSRVRGVDSRDSVEAALDAALSLARFTGGAVAVSGVVDLITDGKVVVRSRGGSHFMEKITGAGCSLGGVCAVYATVTDPLTAAVTATQIYNLAAARAEAQVAGSGSFQVAFIDELYRATGEDVAGNEMTLEVLK
ncbi:MAG: hydroxyethylthiazole kinase [Tissierellia bacterium]|nr:hydroxyethylthiazole kinase [Tissierellia bacterium]